MDVTCGQRAREQTAVGQPGHCVEGPALPKAPGGVCHSAFSTAPLGLAGHMLVIASPPVKAKHKAGLLPPAQTCLLTGSLPALSALLSLMLSFTAVPRPPVHLSCLLFLHLFLRYLIFIHGSPSATFLYSYTDSDSVTLLVII